MPIRLRTNEQITAAKTLRKELLDKQLFSSVMNDASLGVGIGSSAVGLAYLAKLLGTAMKRKSYQPQAEPSAVIHIKPKKKNDPNNFSDQDKLAGIADVLQASVSGTGASNPNQLPYGLPLRALALLSGLGGGAYLANKFNVDVKDVTLDQELARAKQEFEAALNEQDQTIPAENTKLASAFSRMEKAISQSGIEKLARLDKTAANELSGRLGELLGVYALMAMLGGGTAAYYGYNSSLKGRKSKQYELANAARIQRKRMTDPQRPVAVLDQEKEQDQLSSV